jgi:hypothetical protein
MLDECQHECPACNLLYTHAGRCVWSPVDVCSSCEREGLCMGECLSPKCRAFDVLDESGYCVGCRDAWHDQVAEKRRAKMHINYITTGKWPL